MTGLFKRKILHPVIDLLKQGVTPEKISLSIALGGTFGCFPVIGATSLLCGLLSYFLRLNMIAIQAINYAVYPVQILMLVPFVRLGEYVTGSENFPISPNAILSMLKEGILQTIVYFWSATLHAILGWTIIALPAAIFGYFLFLPVLRKTAQKYRNLKGNSKS
ncbi:MAG: DUF2062 domain-containing protein [Leptospira sp.]|nr:DUF2062 domain-containing protein [Leptospira sp.]